MAPDIKGENHCLEVAHLNEIRRKAQNNVILVLTAAGIHCDGELLSRFALPQPELFEKVLHQE
jgi:hypothetical protein